MMNRDDLKRLIDQLPDGATDRAFGLLISLVEGDGVGREMDPETRSWLDADLGGELPPFDWGPEGEPSGKPVHFVPGVGLVVDGGKDVAG